MAQFGYTMLCEQTPARQLVSDLALAERCGFDFSVISDHYFPWLTDMGHSAYAWSVLGAAAQATDAIPLMTFVTCPLMRYHPAVVAQKAATMGVLSGGRFTLGLGAGENLNEHVIGKGWPPADQRHAMLDEAVDIIRRLFTGEYVTHYGDHYSVDSAKLWDLPDSPPPIAIAVSGARSCGLAGARADALIAIQPESSLIDDFAAAGGGGKPAYGQVVMSYDTDLTAARERARRLFRWSVFDWKVNAELPSAVNFESVTRLVREDDVARVVSCGPDVEPHVQAVQAFLDAGFTHIALVQAGPDQQRHFFDWAGAELLPALRSLS